MIVIVGACIEKTTLQHRFFGKVGLNNSEKPRDTPIIDDNWRHSYDVIVLTEDYVRGKYGWYNVAKNWDLTIQMETRVSIKIRVYYIIPGTAFHHS